MLADRQIKELINEEELVVENMGILEERLSPSGLDLTVGSDYKRASTNEVFDANETASQEIVLEPGVFYWLHTVESLVLPNYLQGVTEELLNVSLKGINVTSGVVHPGYSGALVLGVINNSEEPQILYPGDDIVQITFHKLDEPAENPYDSDSKYESQSGL